MIIKVKKTDKYVTMLNQTLEDGSISFKAKGLLAYLLSRPDNWNVIPAQLAAIGKDKRDSIYAGLKELIDGGYIIRDAMIEKGKFIGVEYFVSEEKKKVVPYSELVELNDSEDVIPHTPLTDTVSTDPEKPYNNNKRDIIKKEREQKEKLPKLSLQERKDLLATKISEFKSTSHKYPTALYTRFYNYWTEQKNSIVKKNPDALMRFEVEKFFDIGKRLATWWARTNEQEKKKMWNEDPFLK